MNLRDRVEENLTLYTFGIALSAFIFGLGAYEFVIRMTNNELVRRDSYVLKEKIEKDEKEALAKAPKVRAEDTSVLSKKLADTNADLVACKNKAKAEVDRLTSKLQATENALSAAESKKCPDVMLDNFYSYCQPGKFNVSACIAEATWAASKLGCSAERVDNTVQIIQGLGTPEGIYCSIACYPGSVSIICNSKDIRLSTGLSTQILNYMTLK